LIKTINDLDLRSIPFTRRHTRLFVLEAPVSRGGGGELVGYTAIDTEAPPPGSPGGDGEYGIFLSYSSSTPGYITRYELIQIIPVMDGKPLPYEYQANPGLLTISAGGGTIEICFDGGEILQIRAAGGLGIVFRMKFNMHEQFMDRLDGTVCAGFHMLGEYLFEPTKGSQSHNGRWLGPEMKPADTDVAWTPAPDGVLEGYVKYADYSVNRPEKLNDFDACVKDALSDFERWCEKYEKVPEKYADARLIAIYIVWISIVGEKYNVIDDMIFMMRSGKLTKAVSWHPPYHAMAAYKDVDQAVRFMHVMFKRLDEYGELPNDVSDRQMNWTMTKPPIQGFALDYILEKVGEDALTKEHCEMLYEPMCRWVRWWTTFRDTNGDGLVSYHHADESGWDDDVIFSKGLPLATSDIAAFLVLCMEICSKLAGKLGLADETADWMKRSEDMLKKTIDSFWNGERFICTLDDTGEIVDEESIAVYQAIILGKRLPQEIIDKIAVSVGNPDKFFTVNGFPSLSMTNRYFDVGLSCGAFSLGLIHAPVQCLMTVGLYNAGCRELALESARNWCDRTLEVGIGMTRRDLMGPACEPFERYVPIYPRTFFPGSVASWGAAVFLVLAHLLNEEQ